MATGMESQRLPFVPSTDPKIAAEQLKHAIGQIDPQTSPDDNLEYRKYLQQITRSAWEAALDRNVVRLGEIRDLIYITLINLEVHHGQNHSNGPKAAAIKEVSNSIEFLEVGIRALVHRELEDRPFHSIEIAVLTQLENAKLYMSRGDVCEQLKYVGIECNVPQTGGILANLFSDGWLLRTQARKAEGSPLENVYALALKGRDKLHRRQPNPQAASTIPQVS